VGEGESRVGEGGEGVEVSVAEGLGEMNEGGKEKGREGGREGGRDGDECIL
jgi:hypothetical protein